MIITVTEVGQERTESKNNKSWKCTTVKYTGDQGDKEKTFRSFGPDYKLVASMEAGKTYDVGLKKEGNFWVWTSVTEADGFTHEKKSSSTRAGGGGGANNTGYWDEKFNLDKERFEFDKAKQPLIVRQSCIGYAVDYLKNSSSQPSVEDVLEVASKFEAFVYSTGEEELQNMEVE